ncbi:MAG: MFS transporter [Actinomycetaceae bacterium]|nr:MFS transporter [Actinomycetaceae bacterium]
MTTAAARRRAHVLNSATLTSGVDETVDFFLPLFAGTHLGLTSFQIALIVALTQAVAFIARPVAGIAVDRWNRPLIGACASIMWGLGCIGYALSGTFVTVALSAALTGVAGAFLWVAIRAIIAEDLSSNSGTFADLMSAEEFGGWIILLPAILLLPALGYQNIFLAGAACCFIAAVLLIDSGVKKPDSMHGADATTEFGRINLRAIGAKLRPILWAVALTMAAEAAISLLLLLHLQRAFALEAQEIALVFLPGAIAMSISPPLIHRISRRYGRKIVLISASIASSLFAIGLAFAPDPQWIAIAWILSALSWSAVIPIQQAIISEAVGPSHLGRGLSLYEAATLGGASVGSLVAGFIYEGGNWLLSCLACAVIIVSGTFIIPRALAKLGVADRPPHNDLLQEKEQEMPAGLEDNQSSPPATPKKKEKSVREILATFAIHFGLYTGAVVIASLIVPGFSPIKLIGSIGPLGIFVSGDSSSASGVGSIPLVFQALRIWTIVVIVDLIWSLVELASLKSRK